MRNLVQYLIVLGVAFALAGQSLSGQCCLGAQNLEADSVGGRYRVKAESLTGTGFDAHGPYHFRFRFLEKTAAGEYRELHSFKLRWDVRDHFNMELYVSPTGNGFGIEFPHERFCFYRRDGKEMFRLKEKRSTDLSEDGYSAILLETVWFERSGFLLEEGQVFLPLGAKVTKLLDQQAIWYLQATPEEIKRSAPRIPPLVKRLEGAKPEEGRKLETEILRYGFMAIPALRAAEKGASKPTVKSQIRALLEKLVPWQEVDVKEGWRDPSFIASFLYYPDSQIRAFAVHSLRTLLPTELRKEKREALHDWVQKNRSRLVWDAAKARYGLSKK